MGVVEEIVSAKLIGEYNPRNFVWWKKWEVREVFELPVDPVDKIMFLTDGYSDLSGESLAGSVSRTLTRRLLLGDQAVDSYCTELARYLCLILSGIFTHRTGEELREKLISAHLMDRTGFCQHVYATDPIADVLTSGSLPDWLGQISALAKSSYCEHTSFSHTPVDAKNRLIWHASTIAREFVFGLRPRWWQFYRVNLGHTPYPLGGCRETEAELCLGEIGGCHYGGQDADEAVGG